MPVPLHLRNAPTKLMREQDYGKGYRYPHDEDGISVQDYLPDTLLGTRYYRPTDHGYEKMIGERNTYWEKIKNRRRKEKS